ncbi:MULTISPECIES: T9SS type A sorting domain-containing protein [Flavobacterium]|uniref:T9SS type A sorting domain-containing protein n=1 Tax=Flavobacterium TaxID=237 RepID=UPI001FCC79FD|nr:MULTISPECIES: LamG-like jellyroll fold domain-containing protein [Flavobacterium]UOK43894.1 T9SS type A sorting domain-containing protein [Flavobacterium enshiense]
MRKLLLLFFVLIQANLMSAQSVGDTIRVRGFNHNSISRDTLIGFPNNPSLTFEKIILKYNLRCRNATVRYGAEDGVTGCGEWDYSVNTFIADSAKVEKALSKQPNYTITGFTGTSFPYTSQQTYDHYDFTQKNVVLNSTTSENAFQVGSGSVSMTNLVKTNLKSGRSQMLITAAQLTTAGFTAGNINAIRLNVANSGGMAKFLKIKMKNSTASSMQASAVGFTGFTDVFFRDYAFVNGANRIQFHTPFNWDGTSNIIIEMSFTNGTNGTNIEFVGFPNAENRVLAASNISAINVSGGGYVDIGTQFFNTINSQVTVSFWTKGDSVMPVSNSIIYGYSNNNTDERQLNIHMPWNSDVYFDCGYVGTTFDRLQKAYGSASVIKDVWNHWTFTKNATTGVMNVYLNGALWHTGTGKTKVMNIMNFVLGRLYTPVYNNNYMGRIRELSVWDKELPVATVLAWKNKTIDNTHPDYANLVAYYKLDEQTGQTVTDAKNGVVSQGANLSWDFERGDQLTTTFTESSVLPNITFYRGTYNQTVTNVVTRFSNPRSKKTVKNHSITSMEGVVPMKNDVINTVSTTFMFDTTPENVYNGDTGALLSTLPVTPEGTLSIVDLDYYKRYPYYNEIMSFVSPYGNGLDLGPNGKTWYFDMSDYVKLLKGNKRLVVNGGKWQEEMDLEFLFIVGTPPRNVIQYDQVWQGHFRMGNVSIANIINGSKFTTNNFSFNPSATSFKLKSSITGHGSDGEFQQNGGQVNHKILLNNVEKYNWVISQECSENPIYPQGGSWIFDRQGWCPGQRTLMKEHNLTPNVTPGSTVAMDYRTSSPAKPSGAYEYIATHQVVGYGAPNFTVDAAIEQIKAPNNANAEFTRLNPMCERPIVTIRNTGANTLTSIVLEYWINNASTHQTYTWTGAIASMATTDILLPVNNLWKVGVSSSNNKFNVKINTANGAADGYANNNKSVSTFSLPNVMPSTFKVQLRTNNYPTQNSFTLYDANGFELDTQTFSDANTIHTFTYQLAQTPNSCYHLRVNDSQNDGLYSYFSSAQGTGSLKILDASDNVIKTLNPDFGGGVDYSFSVNTLLSTDDIISKKVINVYPNPSKGHFTVEGDDLMGSEIVVYDILGKVVAERTADNNMVEFNQNNLRTGVYMVKIQKGKQVEVKKLIVN